MALLLGARGCRPVRRPREDPKLSVGYRWGSFVARLSHRDDVGFPNLEMRSRLRRCGELGQVRGKGVHGIVRGSEGIARRSERADASFRTSSIESGIVWASGAIRVRHAASRSISLRRAS